MIVKFLSKDINRKVIFVISMITFVAYAYSMFLYPFLKGGFEWDYAQNVWYAWQPVNAGMLAFMGYGHKPGQYDKSACYDIPLFRCPSKG